VIRYPIIIWFGITVTLLVFIISDAVFGYASKHVTVRRVLLAFIWWLAILSPRGRRVLFDYTEDFK
jgi:hypothetical protein